MKFEARKKIQIENNKSMLNMQLTGELGNCDREVDSSCMVLAIAQDGALAGTLLFLMFQRLGPLATIVYKRLASLISEKSSQPYSMTPYWLRCKLSFSLLHSAITCLRCSRSSYHRFKFSDSAIDLACAGLQ